MLLLLAGFPSGIVMAVIAVSKELSQAKQSGANAMVEVCTWRRELLPSIPSYGWR